MDINREAPVKAKVEVQIAADPQLVWGILTDFARWPTWNADVRSLDLLGPLAPGSTFEWKAGPGTIRSTIGEVDEPRKVAWTGTTLGISAIDVFHLQAKDGGTLVTEEESWEGLPARLFRLRLQRSLQSSLEKGVQALRAEAERRAGAEVTA